MEEEHHVLKLGAMIQTVIFALVLQPTNAIAVMLRIMLPRTILANYAATQSLTAPSAHTLAHSVAQLVLVDTIQIQLLPALLAQADKSTAYIVIQQVQEHYGALIASILITYLTQHQEHANYAQLLWPNA